MVTTGGWGTRTLLMWISDCIRSRVQNYLWYSWWKKSGWPVEVGSLSHYSQDFIHPMWCRISSINSRTKTCRCLSRNELLKKISAIKQFLNLHVCWMFLEKHVNFNMKLEIRQVQLTRTIWFNATFAHLIYEIVFKDQRSTIKTSSILPWKLTCPLKINGWKMYSIQFHTKIVPF